MIAEVNCLKNSIEKCEQDSDQNSPHIENRILDVQKVMTAEICGHKS